MRFGSVCSGIEAASVAWSPLGWEAAWFSEIEPFPSAVLSHHYPDVVNRGDMTKFQEWDDEPIDLLCGGTPCQSFSVAGLRKGLDDPRGNLMLTYLAIASKYRPRWLVWENVPGVLSSNGGKDFGSFLGGLGELGYGFAYRVLDAQYFGVAQRRKRVFVVGYLGDWRPPAAVLFERHSLSGHLAPSREKGQTVAANSASGSDISQPYSVGNTLTARMYKGINSTLDEGQTPVLTPIEVPEVMATLLSSTAGISRPGNAVTEHETYIPMASPVHYRKSRRAQSTADHETWIEDGVSNTLNCFDLGDIRSTDVVAQSMTVRRLTPVECERLQGFPDNYTNIPWRKQAESPDGPRYKALGNSWAVPVVRWIGERIKMFEEMQ